MPSSFAAGCGSIHHVGFSVRDIARSETEFYGPVLGYLGYQRVNGAGRVAFWRNPKGGPTLHLVAVEGELHPPPADHCAFSVDSRQHVDDLHAMLRERNVAGLSAPADYPHFGPGHYAVFFQDPDGRLFEVLHRPSRAAPEDASMASRVLA